jgi:hypothetical protein
LPSTNWFGRQERLTTISRTKNGDGTLALSRYELGECLLEIAERDDNGDAKTGRRYYYLALSHGYIAPDMGSSDKAKKERDAAYKRVTAILGTLRKQGLLSWDMVLDLTRDLVEWQVYASPREARATLRRLYSEDRWLGQPYYPVFIVEKDTMEPVCKPMARGWQMPFASSRGYSSLKLQYDTAKLVRDRHAGTNQPAIIYFVSDHDPSGLDLERVWREELVNFNVAIEDFVRIGLSRDQLQGLPERLANGIEVKPSDSRSARYVELHGDRCWEADILPASIIEQTLDRHIRSWLDQAAWEQCETEILRARQLL